jgi:hypothetical protein
VVVDEGMLCSSPLAEHPLPPDWYVLMGKERSEEGSNAWFNQTDGVMKYMALNTVNHYGTQGSYYSPDFGNYFEAYNGTSAKPLLISEYGVDAYQSFALATSDICDGKIPWDSSAPTCHVMGENDASRTSQVSRPATPRDKGCNRIRAACDHMCAACNRM